MGIEQELRAWATAKIVTWGTASLSGKLAAEVMGILARHEAGRIDLDPGPCPQCGIPWDTVSPDCPRDIWDRHPGTVHYDGRRYLCRALPVFTRFPSPYRPGRSRPPLR